MAVTIDPTPGGASANSYGSLAEANSYFASRLGSAAWTSADNDTRGAALVTAARRLDDEIYRGARASSAQAMQWPRTGTWASQQAIPGDVVPDFLKRAQFEQALQLIEDLGAEGDQNPLAPSGTEELKSLQAGAVRLDFRDRDASATGETPRAADDPSRTMAPTTYRLLRGYILTDALHGADTGIRNFPILRGG